MTIIAGDIVPMQAIADGITVVPSQAVVTLEAASGGKLGYARIRQGPVTTEIDNLAGLTAAAAQLITGQSVYPTRTWMSCLRKKLLVLIGQSNILSRSLVSAVTQTSTANLALPFAQVQLWQYLATSPTNPLVWSIHHGDTKPRTTVPAGDFGIELQLARLLHLWFPGQFAILVMGIGGSSVEECWMPAANYPLLPPGTPNLYAQLGQAIAGAMAFYAADLAGVIQFAGETDATDAGMASRFVANNTSLINGLRGIFGMFPWVSPRLSNGMTVLSELATVQAAQDTLGATVPRYYNLFSNDLGLNDSLHYNGPAIYTLSGRAGITLLNDMTC